jgi:hypothetical protein
LTCRKQLFTSNCLRSSASSMSRVASPNKSQVIHLIYRNYLQKCKRSPEWLACRRVRIRERRIRSLSFPGSVPVAHVAGPNNFSIPHPMVTLPQQAQGSERFPSHAGTRFDMSRVAESAEFGHRQRAKAIREWKTVWRA